MQDEPQSILERQPLVRGQKLAALVFLLWLPLFIAVAAVSFLIEVSLPLIAAAIAGTMLSVGLAIAAVRTTS